MERNWDLESRLVEILGASEVLDNVLLYLDSSKMNEILESIANDFEIDEEEED